MWALKKQLGVSWMPQSTTLILGRFQKAVTLLVNTIPVRFRKQNLSCLTYVCSYTTLRKLCREKKNNNANEDGSLHNKTNRNYMRFTKRPLFFIHVSKIHIHLSFTSTVRVFFKTDFQLPGWFLLKKFPFKSLYVNCCTKAVLWLIREFGFWLDKNN